MSENIIYTTDEIAQFYGNNRTYWDDFYPSEQWIFERAAEQNGSLGHVLDVGCAVGGLGRALAEKRLITSYTGIDINKQAIDAAKSIGEPSSVQNHFISGDIVTTNELGSGLFDTVISLGCADWNIETEAIIRRAWDVLAPGGNFIISLRLTPEKGTNDASQSYQHIVFDDKAVDDSEIAPYVVFNINDAIALLAGQRPAPDNLMGYGYWGPPSSTANTRYDRLVFAVFAVGKPQLSASEGDSQPQLELSLPWDIWTSSDKA